MELWLNGICWRVYRVRSDDPILCMDDGSWTIGVTDRLQKIICVDQHLRGALLRKVLIHEVTHAWMCSYGYALSVDQEEFVCDFVASNADDILAKADELLCMGICRYVSTYS